VALDHQTNVAVGQRLRSEHHQEDVGTNGHRKSARVQGQQFRVR